MEVVGTISASPVYLDILTAGEEVAGAGAGELHCLATIAVDGLGRDVQNDDICKVYRAVVSAVYVLAAADVRVVALLIGIVLEV